MYDTAFPLQQRLYERASLLPYKYVAWLVLNIAPCEFRNDRLMWTDAFRFYYYVTLLLDVVSFFSSPKRDDLPL
jgi:hypothetical protein